MARRCDACGCRCERAQECGCLYDEGGYCPSCVDGDRKGATHCGGCLRPLKDGEEFYLVFGATLRGGKVVGRGPGTPVHRDWTCLRNELDPAGR